MPDDAPFALPATAPTRVKVCGITRAQDAHTAVQAGADALGFMFYAKSPRFIEPDHAATIIRSLPPFVARVGVFVNADPGEVRSVIQTTGIDTVQFHGEESPEFCRAFLPLTVIKAFRIRDAESLRNLPDFPVHAWLLDSYVPGHHGGTGARFNWELAVRAVALGTPVLLAGGLTSDNASDAVRQVRPYALDVSSGVEASPGIKDPGRIRAFIRAAHSTPAAPAA